jgi:hypothetical protein
VVMAPVMLPAVLPRTSVPVSKDGVRRTTLRNTKPPTVLDVSQQRTSCFCENYFFQKI